jgi:hypothetical protein
LTHEIWDIEATSPFAIIRDGKAMDLRDVALWTSRGKVRKYDFAARNARGIN